MELCAGQVRGRVQTARDVVIGQPVDQISCHCSTPHGLSGLTAKGLRPSDQRSGCRSHPVVAPGGGPGQRQHRPVLHSGVVRLVEAVERQGERQCRCVAGGVRRKLLLQRNQSVVGLGMQAEQVLYVGAEGSQLHASARSSCG